MAKFDAYHIEGQFDGTNYVDFKRDIISEVYFDYGIFGNKFPNKCATPGTMKFEMNNTESNSAGPLNVTPPEAQRPDNN